MSSGTSRLSTHEREIVRSIAKNARNARHSLGHVSEGASLALDRAYAAGANIEKQLISFANILQKRPVLRNATGTAMRTDKMKPNGLGELEETPKRSSLSNTTEPTIGVEKTEPNVLSKPQDHRSQTLPKQPALPNAINPTNPTIGMEMMNPNRPNKPVEQPLGNPVSTAPRPLGSPMKFAIVGLVGNKPFGVFTPEEAYIHEMEIERQNNHAEAADLYKEAAACGHVPSMVALGRRLIGIDDRTAAGWFLAAAESGSAMGWTELGYMYSQGYGVERSSTRGTACRKRAAFLNGKLVNSCDKRVARAAPVSDQRWSGSTSTG